MPKPKLTIKSTIPSFVEEGRCYWCGATIVGRRKKYCCVECADAYTAFWYKAPAYKRAVFIRDDFTCQICGIRPVVKKTTFEIPNIRGLHCDHIVPVYYDGETTLENLQTLCASCNLKKGHKIDYSIKPKYSSRRRNRRFESYFGEV